MPTLDELKVLKAKAKIEQAEAKKLAKKKPPKPRKQKKYADGGEEQWDNRVAVPRVVKGKKDKNGQQLTETFQLDTGEWSFSPNPPGPVSLYGARANRAYGWDGQKVVVKDHAGSMAVWWYDRRGVCESRADSAAAIEARQKYQERMTWPSTS